MKIVRPIDINSSVLTSSNISEDDFPAWNVGTIYSKEQRVIYVEPFSVVTITIASPAVISWINHNLPLGQAVIFSTTGGLPTGIDEGVAYYVVDKTADAFNLSTVVNGAPLVTSGTQSGVHTATASIHLVFESLRNDNVGKTPTVSPTHWLQVSATNRWRMFDQSVSSESFTSDTIDVKLQMTGRSNSVAVLNTSGSEVRVIMTDPVEGVVYDRTESLLSTNGINNWYAWYFNPIIRKKNVLFADLPTYSNTEINVIVTDQDSTPKLGALVVGNFTEIGSTQYGMSVGIIDFSVKDRDSFGHSTIVERGFSRRSRMNVWVENSSVDDLVNTLAEIRATAAVYEGSDQFGSSLIYGFFRDFDIGIERPTASMLSISVEGLV